MKIVSFNVNGVRARLHQLQAVIEKHAPDIIGLQEIKVADEAFPLAAIEALGYQAVYYGQKSHYGVALLSRVAPLEVSRGLPGQAEDAQRRLITATYRIAGHRVRVLNAYWPQGESRQHAVKFPAKERFYRELADCLKELCSPREPLILMGDANVAPEEKDIGIGAENARRWLRSGKCSFLPEERQWLQRLFDWGLADTFRHCHPDLDDRFSWFDYRSRGFEKQPPRGLRIDLILATAPLRKVCSGADIDYAIRGMDKPSDHCPIWAQFDLSPSLSSSE